MKASVDDDRECRRDYTPNASRNSLSRSSCSPPSTMENAGKTTPFDGPGRGFESHSPHQSFRFRPCAGGRHAAVAQAVRAGTFSRSLSPSLSVSTCHPSLCSGRQQDRFHLVGRECRRNYTLLMSGSRVRIPLVAHRCGGSSAVEQVFRHSCHDRRSTMFCHPEHSEGPVYKKRSSIQSRPLAALGMTDITCFTSSVANADDAPCGRRFESGPVSVSAPVAQSG